MRRKKAQIIVLWFMILTELAIGGAVHGRKVKIVTTGNETIEGQFQGATDEGVAISIAGQKVTIPWDSVAQLLFQGHGGTSNSSSDLGLVPSGTSGGSAPRTSTGNGTSTQNAASGRCQAITKKGTQCKRSAKPGSIYCWQHGG